jgi:hypothetical protein
LWEFKDKYKIEKSKSKWASESIKYNYKERRQEDVRVKNKTKELLGLKTNSNNIRMWVSERESVCARMCMRKCKKIKGAS